MGVAKKVERFTYRDYLSWEDGRWELIDGEAYDMSPSPTRKHQMVSRNITGVLFNHKEKMKEKGCSFYEAPMDVVFDDYNVVQPDIFVVCDEKEKGDYIYDVPVLVIEIISPSTEIKDKREKLRLYERFGVKEYIIIHPDREYAERYVLTDGKYLAPDVFRWDEALKLKTFDIELKLWGIFEKELPDADGQKD